MNMLITNNSNNNNIPKPTIFFILDIFLTISFLLAGGFLCFISFTTTKKEIFKSTLILGQIFLIIGIIFLIITIKQIKLRITWNNKNNLEVKEENLTYNEDNKYQFMYINDPTYRSKKLDKIMGIKHEAKLKNDKYGNTYYESSTKFEHDNYFSSLFVVLFMTFIISICLFNIVKSIIYKDYFNAIFFLMGPFPFAVIVNIIFIKELIKGFKEKVKVKKEIKEGKIKKEPLSVGSILYLSFNTFLLMFFAFCIIWIIMEKKGYTLSPVLIDKIIYYIPLIFISIIVIIIIFIIKDHLQKK